MAQVGVELTFYTAMPPRLLAW